jgi:hypothetical protein
LRHLILRTGVMLCNFLVGVYCYSSISALIIQCIQLFTFISIASVTDMKKEKREMIERPGTLYFNC